MAESRGPYTRVGTEQWKLAALPSYILLTALYKRSPPGGDVIRAE